MPVLSDEEIGWGYQEIRIPCSIADPMGPFVLAVASVESYRTDCGIACIERLPEQAGWLEEYDKVLFEALDDGKMLKAIRLATDEDIQMYRVPIWIQGEEVPQCCGKPMCFVGQIDDNRICCEAPPDAVLWWHDTASFYVFTCSQCLEVKAVGQQY